MNLVKFLTVGVIISIILGEFGQFPFGVTSASFSITDILLALTVGLLLVWQVGIKKNVVMPKTFLVLLFFSVMGVVSLVFSGEFRGGLYLVRYFLYSFSFLLGYVLVKDEAIDVYDLTKVMVYSGLVLAVLGFLQLVFIPNLDFFTGFGFDPHQGRLVSTFLDPNFAGLFLNMSFVLAIFLWFKYQERRWLVLGGIFILAIILTFSRSAFLVLALELLLLGVLKSWRVLVVTVLVFGLVFLSVPRFSERIVGGLKVDKSASERLDSWGKGLAVFYQHPTLGVGFNNLRFAYQQNNLFKVFSPDGGNSGAGVDSSLIFVLATTGIVGFLVFLGFWINYFFAIFKGKLHKDVKLILVTLVLGLFVGSQFVNGLFYPPILFFALLVMGSFYAVGDI